MTKIQFPTPMTDKFDENRFRAGEPDWEDLIKHARQLERELAEEKHHHAEAERLMAEARIAKARAEEAAQSATAAIPEGYHLVCKVCGSIPGDVCLAPSRCPVASRSQP